MSQVDHPDRRKCKPSQAKKKKSQPTGKMMLINQECFLTSAQRAKAGKGRAADCAGFLLTAAVVADREDHRAPKTLRETPPPPVIPSFAFPLLSLSSRHSIDFKGTSVTPRSQPSHLETRCCRGSCGWLTQHWQRLPSQGMSYFVSLTAG